MISINTLGRGRVLWFLKIFSQRSQFYLDLPFSGAPGLQLRRWGRWREQGIPIYFCEKNKWDMAMNSIVFSQYSPAFQDNSIIFNRLRSMLIWIIYKMRVFKLYFVTICFDMQLQSTRKEHKNGRFLKRDNTYKW